MKVLYYNTYECMLILIWNVYELFISIKKKDNIADMKNPCDNLHIACLTYNAMFLYDFN